ncbi:hypothetical protein [Georgenia deserti]|uniref:PE domain-containing protein n=1 Tax=Georgenia deserti TaxID=2093781 RepID=A0ABW4L7B9_9MICO
MSDIWTIPAGLEAAAGNLEEVRTAVAGCLPVQWTGAGAESYAGAVFALLDRVSAVSTGMYATLPAVRSATVAATAEIAGTGAAGGAG